MQTRPSKNVRVLTIFARIGSRFVENIPIARNVQSYLMSLTTPTKSWTYLYIFLDSSVPCFDTAEV